MSQITNIAAATATLLNASPYLVGNPVHFESVAGGTLKGLNLAGRDARGGSYQRWNGDGSTTTWTPTAVVNLANAKGDGGSLDEDNILQVVILVNGSPLKRVQSDATPAAGEFKTASADGGDLVFGDTLAVTDKIEVFLDDGTNISDDTLVANTPKEVAARQVVYCTAACSAIRLTR